MVDVETEILIDRPLNAVSVYAADPDNAPQWYANIKSVEWHTPKPLRPGARIQFTAEFLGRKLVYVYEIAECVPGQILTMRTASGPFPMETTYQWEAIGPNTTRMTLRNRGAPAGFSALVAPFMAFAMRRENRKDLQRLKKIVEQTAAVDTGSGPR